MTAQILLLAILVPSLASVGALLFCKKSPEMLGRLYLLILTALNLVATWSLFHTNLNYATEWGALIHFSLRTDPLSSFILAAGGFFAFVLGIYTVAYMKRHRLSHHFYFYYLLTIGMFNGAVLADNLVVFMFFWEGLLVTLFGMIYVGGGENAFKTAIKAFIIGGVGDLCLMLGVGLMVWLAGTAEISHITIDINGPQSGIVAFMFILMMVGAIAKAGLMPFHSWIPDAAIDAPLPFMALVASALQKLLGIYLVARLSLDLFKLDATSWVSPFMMTIGVITVLLAVLMALVQTDYKRLLAFQSISQVGFIVLAIGTFSPVGIVGGLFQLINLTLFTSGLFMVGGMIEKHTGTTDLDRLGGLSGKMPMVFGCFIIMAAAGCGIPPFNAFFSKELIYDAALQRGGVYYGALVLGTFLMVISFLKLTHATFLRRPDNSEAVIDCREKMNCLTMMIPTVLIALVCIGFGLFNAWPVTNLIIPIKPEFFGGEHFYGFPPNMMLVIVSMVVLVLAFFAHIYGVKVNGSGAAATDHIRNAPILKSIFDKAEESCFDPYEILQKGVNWFGRLAMVIDKAIDYFYNQGVVRLFFGLSKWVRKLHNGSHVTYLLWAIIGLVLVVVYVMGGN